MLAILNVKNVLEIHTELTGFTKKFILFNNNSKIKKYKVYFYSENLKKYFNLRESKSIILMML